MKKNPEIRLKRAASLLKELIPEAFGNLDDPMLQNLCVTDVVVKRGMYDADIFLDTSFFEEDEKKEILKRLKKAHTIIEGYCLETSGWFRCPKFHFKFDNRLEEEKRIEELFRKIREEG
jgi:ribosome-binding factor A